MIIKRNRCSENGSAFVIEPASRVVQNLVHRRLGQHKKSCAHKEIRRGFKSHHPIHSSCCWIDLPSRLSSFADRHVDPVTSANSPLPLPEGRGKEKAAELKEAYPRIEVTAPVAAPQRHLRYRHRFRHHS
jgi:hypothetical protein